MTLSKRLFLFLAVFPLVVPVMGWAVGGTADGNVDAGRDISAGQAATNANTDTQGTVRSDGTKGSVIGTTPVAPPPKRRRRSRPIHIHDTSGTKKTKINVNSPTNNSAIANPGTMGNRGTSNTGTSGTSTSSQ